jgi:hypothetical protein
MFISIRLTGTFDATTVLPSDAQLVEITGYKNMFTLADAAGVSLVNLGIIPMAFFAELLGAAMGRVAVVYHDAGAGVTEARAAAGAYVGGNASRLTKTRVWNPSQSNHSPGFPVLNRDWVIVLSTNAVGVQSILLEILPLDERSALAAAEDTEAFGESGGLAADVASEWTAVQTSAYDAGAGQLVAYDASGGAFTITLPASPLTGDVIGFIETANSAVNAITISGNGNNVRGTAGTLGATAAYQIASGNLFLKFDGTDWQIVGVRD